MKSLFLTAICLTIGTALAPVAHAQSCNNGSGLGTLLSGLVYSYHYETVGGSSTPISAVGLFGFGAPTATNQQNGATQGLITIEETINTNGYIARQSTYTGRYIVNSDCSGGEIQYSGHVFDFVVVGSYNNATGLYFTSTGGNPGGVLKGEAQVNLIFSTPPPAE